MGLHDCIASLCLAAALPVVGVASGPIGKFDDKTPDFAGSVPAKLEDIERCLIDLPKSNAPLVYRQPDRPDSVTLLWTSPYGLGVARVDLARDGNGTKVTSWLERDDARQCFGRPR